MATNDNPNFRTTFDKVVNLYQTIRPTYPEELFEKVIKITKLSRDGKLLEIGPGTGQATEPFARRGYDIIAVELGASLAETTRKLLSTYKNVKVITGAFEEVDLPKQSFDLIYAATAFHWIKPEFKFSKPHELLKDAGHLAIINTKQVSDEQGDEFFFASQPLYKQYKPGGEYDTNFQLESIKNLTATKVDENFFSPIFFEAFPVFLSYSAEEYIQLLGTYSPVLSMTQNERESFLDEIKRLIEEKFHGIVTRNVAMTLTIAKKK